jgi:hypothetical protein
MQTFHGSGRQKKNIERDAAGIAVFVKDRVDEAKHNSMIHPRRKPREV